MPLRYDDDEPIAPVVPLLLGVLPNGLYDAFGATCEVMDAVVLLLVEAGAAGDQLGSIGEETKVDSLVLILLRYEDDEPIDPAPTVLVGLLPNGL